MASGLGSPQVLFLDTDVKEVCSLKLHTYEYGSKSRQILGLFVISAS